MAYATGIYTPPAVVVSYAGTSPLAATTQLYSLRLSPGSAPCTATIGWPSTFAESIISNAGDVLSISIGGAVILRGAIVAPSIALRQDGDETTATIACDKWRMAARIIGEVGVGTVPAEGDDAGSQGFSDIGLEIVFNAGGRPNKAAASLDFCSGSSAVSWTLEDILQFIFEHYVDAEVAVLPEEFAPGTTWTEREPADLDLTGMSVPQAIDALCELAGDSWALSYSTAALPSTFALVRPGTGTQRTVDLFVPGAESLATEAAAWHATLVSHDADISESRDIVQVISHRAVKEHTYFSFGDDALLAGSALIADKEYYVRFSVDVTKYAAHNLGPAMSAGSPALPWLQRLVTRQDESTGNLVTAAALAADPTKRDWPGIDKPYLWMTLDTEADPVVWRLVTGGYRIDFEHAFIDFKSTFELATDDGKTEEFTREGAGSWVSIGLAATVATVMLLPETVETAPAALYLPESRTVRVDRMDLIPERRQAVVLPNLSSYNPNDTLTVAAAEEETYVDIADDLAMAIAASTSSESALPHQARIEFDFLPPLAVGDRISFNGRLEDVPEMVTGSIEYAFNAGCPVRLVASASTSVRNLPRERRRA